MSGRARVRGTALRQRQVTENENEVLAGGEFPTPDETNYEEEEGTERQTGDRSSTRKNRLKRRKDQKEKDEDLYERILQASGIDTEGMDAAEKDQLAKVLLESKSEAGGDHLSVETGGDHLSVEAETRSESRTSVISSTDSVSFLQENTLRQEPLTLDSQDLAEFEDKDTQPGEASPLNGSMSQIFSQVASDDEETQPPSPGLLDVQQVALQSQANLQTRGGNQDKRSLQRQRAPPSEKAQSSIRAPLADITVPNSQPEVEISDCATLAEDMVDGDLPSNSNHSVTHYLSDPEDSEPMILEQIPPAEFVKVIEADIHRSKVRDSDSQESDIPGNLQTRPSMQRKRKASNDSESRPKQSRVDSQSDEDMESFCIGSYLGDGEKSPQTKFKPLKRRYRRQRRVTREKRLYCPNQSREDCNHYTSVIYQLLDVYRTKLRDAQYGRLCHVAWGDPVKTGRHMSRTIDLKCRGRDSCYWEDLSESEDEDFENEIQNKLTEKADKTDPIYNLSDDEDFNPAAQRKILPLRKTRSNTDENKSLRERKWLTTRGDNPVKNERKIRKPRGITKPALDFLSETDDFVHSKTSEKCKESNVSVKNVKTYSRKSARKVPVVRDASSDIDDVQESPEEIMTLSPVNSQTSTNKDKMENENEEEAVILQRVSPLFNKPPSSSGGKKSASKIFTFASTEAGKIKVSEKISHEDDDDFLPSPQKISQDFLLRTQSSPKFSKTLSRTRNRNEIQESSSKGDYSNSVEEVSIFDDLEDNEETNLVKEIVPNRQSDKEKANKNKSRFTFRRKIALDDDLSGNTNNYQTKNRGVSRQLNIDGTEKRNVSEEKSSILDLAEGHHRHGDTELDDNMSGEKDVIFSGKKRKLSNLFSDSDESFNLGVTPAKAFSAVFESLSDESPTASGVDIAENQAVTERQTKTKSPQFDMQINLVRPSIHMNRASDSEEIDQHHDGHRPESSNSKSMSVKPRNKRNTRGQVKKRSPSPPVQENEPIEILDVAGHVESTPIDLTPEKKIACPLCCREFGVKLIEAHAANCNGDTADNEEEGVEDPGWRVTVETGEDPEDGDEDKCYICDKRCKRGDNYERHVNQCLAEAKRQQEELEKGRGLGGHRGRTTRTRRYRQDSAASDEDGISFHGNQEVIAKSMRRKVENGSAVVDNDSPCFTPSESESESDTSSEPNDDKGENPSQMSREKTADIDFDRVSDSPIKTFRKIGQLDDCLIDFSNQFKKSDKLKRRPVKTKTGKKRKRTVKKKSKTVGKQSTKKR